MSRYEGLHVLDYDVAPVNIEATWNGSTTTISVASTPTKMTGTMTQRGDATVPGSGAASAGGSVRIGSANEIELITQGPKILRVQGLFLLNPVATTDALGMQIFVNGVQAFATANRTVAAASPQLFGFDEYIKVFPSNREFPNRGKIELYVLNDDTTADVVRAAFIEDQGIQSATAATDTTRQRTGWWKVSG